MSTPNATRFSIAGATRILALCLAATAAWAQPDVRFTVSVSTDSILFGNYCKVAFTLENAGGGHFEAPPFEGFRIVSGPNVSQSISMGNGRMSQTISYTYYLEPHDVGRFYIPPAAMTLAGQVYETDPLEVYVLPNPEGIKQDLPNTQRQPMDWGWGRDLWENLRLGEMPNMDLNFEWPQFEWPEIKVTPPRDETSPRSQDENENTPTPPTKKRKTTRL